MSAHIVTTEDLIHFKRELLEDIKAIVNNTPSEAKRWLRSPEVRQLLDISPGTLQNLRINNARELLRHSNLGVSEIAWQLGLQDVSYFSQLFRRHCGVSPLRYREAVRGKLFEAGSLE